MESLLPLLWEPNLCVFVHITYMLELKPFAVYLQIAIYLIAWILFLFNLYCFIYSQISKFFFYLLY